MFHFPSFVEGVVVGFIALYALWICAALVIGLREYVDRRVNSNDPWGGA